MENLIDAVGAEAPVAITTTPPNSDAEVEIAAEESVAASSSPAANGSPPAPTAVTAAANTDPHAWTRAQVWAIRYHKKYNEDQKRRILNNFIITQENRKTPHGAFLKTPDKRAYLFDGHACRLYRIDEKDAEFRGYMQVAYGLNSSEQLTRHLMSSLQNGTIATGLPRELRRFSHWDRNTQTLYISRYDGTCYKIDGTSVTVVPNGAGPAIFRDDDGGTPADGMPPIYKHGVLLPSLIDDLQYAPATVGGMAPDTQRRCLAIWLLITAFADLMPAKPLLLVEGEKGSGKTVALQRTARVLHGKHMPLSVPKKEDKDFGVTILRSPIAILDDINEPRDWLRDTLCTYATGGGWTRRALFTDDTEVTIKPNAFLAITTNNPATFRQAQVADRCLIIRLERREDNDGFLAAEDLFAQVDKLRPEIVGEWLYYLNLVVAELRATTGQPIAATKTRMADFARLAHVIWRVLRRGMFTPADWSTGLSVAELAEIDKASFTEVEEMLAAMNAERTELVVEGDLVLQWRRERCLAKSAGAPPAGGAGTTASEPPGETDVEDLHDDFILYSGDVGARPLARHVFGRRLSQLGIKRRPGTANASMYPLVLDPARRKIIDMGGIK